MNIIIPISFIEDNIIQGFRGTMSFYDGRTRAAVPRVLDPLLQGLWLYVYKYFLVWTQWLLFIGVDKETFTLDFKVQSLPNNYLYMLIIYSF